MDNRFLGKSKLLLSPIGLGTWQFSKGTGFAGKYWETLTDEIINEIVLVSLDNGINWFDTAEVYGNGESEKALANALIKSKKPSSEIHIATKWNPVMRTANSIDKSINERLTNLKGYPIDLFQIHNPYSFSSIKDEMKIMAVLVKSDKIKNIGVSNYNVGQMLKAHAELKINGLNLISNQVKYNLLDRKIETNGVLQAAKENNIAIIAYSPLEQGLLTGKFHDNPELIKEIKGYRKYRPLFKKKNLQKSLPLINELKKIAQKYQVTPAQVSLNWIINFHGDFVFAIPGASKVQQAKENALAMSFKLSEDEMKRIDEYSSIFK